MNRTDLPIATPCTVDWTTMTLADRGRFCGECKKVVRELAQLTESEARALLASPPTEGLCVRYVHDTTGEILFRRDLVPAGRLARMGRAAAVAVAVASIPLAAAGCMGTAPMPPPTMGAVRPVPAEPEPAVETMGAATMGTPPIPATVTPPAPSVAPVATDPSAPRP
jgi:hypothetical protein